MTRYDQWGSGVVDVAHAIMDPIWWFVVLIVAGIIIFNAWSGEVREKRRAQAIERGLERERKHYKCGD